MDNEATEAAATFQDRVNEANVLFDRMCVQRHAVGQEKYGPVKFMDVNTLNEAMEEVVDIANYARYTFVKLYVLNLQIDKIIGDVPDMLGPQSFIPSKGEQ